MTPSPILKVLSTIRRHRVRALLMGGQACVAYGAAEFTRDVDLLIRLDPANLARVRAALDDLRAEPVYVPDLSLANLQSGHACHFRCGSSDVSGLRVDLMAVVRGLAEFDACWRRRCEVRSPKLLDLPLLSPPDLVISKKTQRDKDWPMIAKLVEADYRSSVQRGIIGARTFWLREARSAELLKELVVRFPRTAARVSRHRPAVAAALLGDDDAVRTALSAEQAAQQEIDRHYWRPLRAQLEQWRHQRANLSKP